MQYSTANKLSIENMLIEEIIHVKERVKRVVNLKKVNEEYNGLRN